MQKKVIKIIKTIRVMLIPNNKQKTKLFQYANTARFAYNWALAKEQENYKNGGKFLSDTDLRKEFTKMKQTQEYAWLNRIDCDVPKQAIKDACNAYKKFFKGLTKFPKFKSRRKSTPSFYQDNVKIQFSNAHVRLMLVAGKGKAKNKRSQKICRIRLAEHNRIPTNYKYSNPRIKFDGLNWWITVGIEYPVSVDIPKSEGIGIDLGIKDLAVCSDGNKYKNINKDNIVKKIEKKKRRLQRSMSRSYEKNKKGKEYCKTNNVIKKEKLLLKITHRSTDIRQNYLHQTTSEIIKQEPSFICIEDLNVKGMMKNRHLSKAVASEKFYEFREKLMKKCHEEGIELRVVSRWYPSSRKCHSCGCIRKDLKLSDRIYRCSCGYVEDRDRNAALNLKDAETYEIA